MRYLSSLLLSQLLSVCLLLLYLLSSAFGGYAGIVTHNLFESSYYLTNTLHYRCGHCNFGNAGDAEEMTYVELGPVGTQGTTGNNPAYLVDDDVWPEYAQFHFDRDKLEFGAELGKGHFGKVLKAWAVGITCVDEKMEVAVKTVREGTPIEVLERFKKEIRTLADFDHVNIIRLLGTCLLRTPLYMITELMNKV